MIPCKECIEGLRPDDPRIRAGKYNMCGCDYCNKPTYYREIEGINQEPQEVIHLHYTSDMSKQEYDLLQQTALKVTYLLKKVSEKQSLSKKNRSNYIYNSIKEEDALPKSIPD